MASVTPSAGERLGEWVLDVAVGSGGHCRLFLAHHVEEPARRAAVKVLISPGDARLRARLKREAEVLRRIDHPHVVGLLDADADAPQPWIALKWIAGHPLSQWVRRPPRPFESIVEVGLGLAEALTAIHREGLAHRDVKPGNVMVRPDGRAVLVDFGLVLDPGAASLTLPGSHAPTTTRYAPPEWHAAGEEPDPSLHDAYGLGLVLWELLVGSPVPEGPHDDSFDPGAQIDPALRMLVRGLTTPDPAQRQSVVAATRILSRLAPTDTTFATLGGAPTPTPMADRIGPYLLEGVLGRGAMGIVYRARRLHGDAPAGPEVALKMLPWGAAESESGRRRLLREARAASSLDHDNLVGVLESGEVDGVPFVVMELVEGETLADRLQRGALPPREAAALVAGLADALAHAHARSVVHRDVKPSNVLIDADGQALLTDFGIARQESEQGTRLTLTGQLVGTPAYMSPEQARGEGVGAPTDVWALGILLHELVVGSVPWHGTHAARVLHQVLSDPPAPLRRRAEVPRALDHVVSRMLVPDPALRPSAASVAQDLRAIANGQDHKVAALSLRARVTAFRPSRLQLGLAAAVVLAGVIGAGFASWNAYSWVMESQRRQAAEARLQALLDQAESWPEERRLQRLEEAIATFGREPALRGTPAEAKAWLALAERLQASGDDEAWLSAMARAYTASEEGEERYLALESLAQRFHENWQWTRLAHVLPQLEGRDAAVLREARRDLALVRRELREAPADRSTAVVHDLLSHTTSTPWIGTNSVARMGPDRLVVRAGRPESTLHVLAARPELPELYRCDVPSGFRLFPAGLDANGRDLFVASHESTHEQRILHCDADGTEIVQTWVGDNTRMLERFRPTADAEPLRLIGTAEGGRDLLALERGEDGTWTTRSAHPPTNALDSGVHALLSHDLDQDGVEELAVGLGPWNAYEMRILRWEAGALHLASRVELGVIDQAAVIDTPEGPRIVASVIRRYRNRRVFPDPPHFGSPAGLYFLAFDGSELSVTGSLPMPDEQCDDVFPGDVDGDGLTDLLLGCRSLSMLVHQQPDGSFESRVLSRELFVEGVLDLDGDGDDEVIAVDGTAGHQTVVLGAGEKPLSPVPLEPLPVQAPPEDLPAEQRDSWRRAEDLVAWGLHEPARGSLRTIAALSAGTRTSALALLRAGQVAETVLDTDAAEARYREAAQSPGGREAANVARLDLLERQHRYREALELARSVDAPDEAWQSRTRALEALVLPTAIGLGEAELDPGWGVGNGVSARFDAADGSLRVRGRGQIVLRRRVRWDGRPVVVDVDLTMHRMSLGGLLRVVLIDPQDQRQVPMGVIVRANGGGGLQFVDHDCWVGSRWQARNEARWMFAPDGDVVDRDSAVVERRWRASAYLRPELPTGLCSDVRGGGRRSLFPDPTYFESWRPFGPGEYELLIEVDGQLNYERAWVDATLHHLEVGGVVPLDGAHPSVFPEVHAALANRRPAEALQLLEQHTASAERELLVAVAHTALDERERAAAALRAALDAGAEGAGVEALVRTSPGWFESTLVQWDEERGWDLIGGAWEDGIVDHPAMPEFQNFVATLPPPPLPSADADDGAQQLRTWLILRRCQRLRELGRRSEAEGELARVSRAIGGREHAEEWEAIERLRVRELARILDDRGDRQGAVELLTRSVWGATSPVMASLTYDRDPVLAGVRADPAWRTTVRDAARGRP